MLRIMKCKITFLIISLTSCLQLLPMQRTMRTLMVLRSALPIMPSCRLLSTMAIDKETYDSYGKFIKAYIEDNHAGALQRLEAIKKDLEAHRASDKFKKRFCNKRQILCSCNRNRLFCASGPHPQDEYEKTLECEINFAQQYLKQMCFKCEYREVIGIAGYDELLKTPLMLDGYSLTYAHRHYEQYKRLQQQQPELQQCVVNKKWLEERSAEHKDYSANIKININDNRFAPTSTSYTTMMPMVFGTSIIPIPITHTSSESREEKYQQFIRQQHENFLENRLKAIQNLLKSNNV